MEKTYLEFRQFVVAEIEAVRAVENAEDAAENALDGVAEALGVRARDHRYIL